MSRMSKPQSSIPVKSQIRSRASSSQLRPSSPSGPTRSRTKSTTKPPTPDLKEQATKPPLSIREAIALKRAEAKKAQNAGKAQAQDTDNAVLEQTNDQGGRRGKKVEEEDSVDLGRLSVRESVERARSTGNLHLSSRSLACIPSCLFEIHLGITPAPLKLASETDTDAKEEPRRRGQERSQVAWFEAQDLQVIKARLNEIVELQPEISLFGSLKTIDLHSNRLETIPASFTALASLTSLDLSSNRLTHLPPSLFSLPSLTLLNVSHNKLTSLPFAQFDSSYETPGTSRADSFFAPEVKRADCPLPSLHNLDASHNQLESTSIDASHLPANIISLTLSTNPLGYSADLVRGLAKLEKLKELRMDGADIDDEAFPPMTSTRFPHLQLLDLGESKVTEQAIRSFFAGSDRENGLTFDITTSDPEAGELRAVIGKKVIKEAWEIEAEKRFLKKRGAESPVRTHSTAVVQDAEENVAKVVHVEKEPWEIEAEQGLLTEAGRRRARAAAAGQASSSTVRPPSPPRPKIVQKEPWEIEAEQGLLTEGGRRRARAQAAASSATERSPRSVERAVNIQPTSSPLTLANSTYYSAATLTLTLPASVPPTRGHARAFSLAASPQEGKRPNEDLTVPTPTLPLSVIAKQDFAATLRVLILKNRKADLTFTLPSSSSLSSGTVLPNLEELDLEGCMLGDTVAVSQEPSSDTGSPKTRRESTVELIANLFPSVSVLNLSYNAFTADAFTTAALFPLLLSSPEGSSSPRRKGLKILRLRGNGMSNLDGFEGVAALFKGNRQVDGWRLEELDVRDNNVAKLPVLMGLLPLDVFLVDGNVFRSPARKVWEREGTKGLLSWLRGRIE